MTLNIIIGPVLLIASFLKQSSGKLVELNFGILLGGGEAIASTQTGCAFCVFSLVNKISCLLFKWCHLLLPFSNRCIKTGSVSSLGSQSQVLGQGVCTSKEGLSEGSECSIS